MEAIEPRSACVGRPGEAWQRRLARWGTARRTLGSSWYVWRGFTAWLGLAALLLFAAPGCTSLPEYLSNGLKVGHDYRRPPVPIEPDWIDAQDRRIQPIETDAMFHWWTLLKDPVLDALVADSYRQNLTLREAGFRILQARAIYGIALGNFFPQQQSMNGDYLREAISTAAANRPFVQERFFDQFDLGFSLSWELDFWGRYRRGIAAADADLDASVEDYDAVLVTLLGDVAQAYILARIYEAQIAYTRANVALQTQTLMLATARFKGGLVTELDVDQAQSILSQTEAQIPQLEISLRQTTNQLCVLLGIPPEELRTRMGPGRIPTAPPDVAVGIPADLVRRRPDVSRAERLAAGQAERIGIAVSDFYPHISLTGALDWQAQRFNDLLSPKALQGAVGPTFQWNLLNYGRILNNVRAQDALFQQLVLDYQNKVLIAAAESETGLITFLKSQEQTRFMAESVRAAEKAVVIAVAQYKGGLVDFNRVSLVEQNLVTQQNLYAQAFGSIALGLVQTYRALGGGWQIRLDPNAANLPGLPGTRPGPAGEEVPAPAVVPQPQPVPAPPGGPKAFPGTPPATPKEPAGAPQPMPQPSSAAPAQGPTLEQPTANKKQAAGPSATRDGWGWLSRFGATKASASSPVTSPTSPLVPNNVCPAAMIGPLDEKPGRTRGTVIPPVAPPAVSKEPRALPLVGAAAQPLWPAQPPASTAPR